MNRSKLIIAFMVLHLIVLESANLQYEALGEVRWPGGVFCTSCPSSGSGNCCEMTSPCFAEDNTCIGGCTRTWMGFCRCCTTTVGDRNPGQIECNGSGSYCQWSNAVGVMFYRNTGCYDYGSCQDFLGECTATIPGDCICSTETEIPWFCNGCVG